MVRPFWAPNFLEEAVRADPASRAAWQVQAAEARARSLRTAAGLALGAIAAIAPFVAEPVTGGSGAAVAAVVAALLLTGSRWPSGRASGARRSSGKAECEGR